MIFIVDSAKKKTAEAQQSEEDTRIALEPLRKYSKIRDVEAAEKKIIKNSIEIQKEIADRTRKIKEYKGELEIAVEAMRNAIEGYGDEYILPVDSILDELAEDFSHKNAGVKLKEARKESKTLIKEDLAATSSPDAPHEVITLALDAFNSKADDILVKVKSDNYGKLKQQLKDAFIIVNQLGKQLWNVKITKDYLDARLLELKWATRARALQLKEREEQKAMREAIREEERAIREAEKARKEAENEERMLALAMETARKQYETASEADRQKYELEMRELEERIVEAEEKNKRAISLAQQTKRGNIYIISNIGSFGEGIYKIGMTRRFEPMDRVKELGDASVPFPFDVHAMIQCEDAPKLENELHHAFHERRVNQVNTRKEFFKVPLTEIKATLGRTYHKDVHWTMKSEAAEYRETIAKERIKISDQNVNEESDILDQLDYKT